MLFAQVRSNRQMCAATGINRKKFEELVPLFAAAYEERYELTLHNRLAHQALVSKLSTV